MTKIKLCGMKRMQDIEYVNKYLPEYAGFVFASGKRKVTADETITLRNGLASNVKAVGVFVNEDITCLIETCKKCTLDCIQLHGDEDNSYIEQLKDLRDSGIELWKAIRIQDEATVESLAMYNVDVFVLDAYTAGQYGGAGKTFDWRLARRAKKFGKIILAGGLNIENVSDAVNCVEPYCVDVSSGIESDGVKDGEKIRQFVQRVRSEENL